jgi:hypothetical protein
VVFLYGIPDPASAGFFVCENYPLLGDRSHLENFERISKINDC